MFLDADRPSYLTYLELLVPKLRPGGILVADNVTSHAHELQDYLRRVKSHPRLFTVTVPLGNGEEIALKPLLVHLSSRSRRRVYREQWT